MRELLTRITELEQENAALKYRVAELERNDLGLREKLERVRLTAARQDVDLRHENNTLRAQLEAAKDGLKQAKTDLLWAYNECPDPMEKKLSLAIQRAADALEASLTPAPKEAV